MEAIIEVFGLDTKLLFIQAVNFALLLIILWWFLYRPLARIVGERQQVIEKGVKDAEKIIQLHSKTLGKSISRKLNQSNRFKQKASNFILRFQHKLTTILHINYFTLKNGT